MKSIKEFIVTEVNARATGARFKNSGGDIADLASKWLYSVMLATNQEHDISGDLKGVFKDGVISFNLLKSHVRFPQIKITGKNLKNGEIPGYIRFDKPVPALWLQEVQSLNTMSGIPDVSDVFTLYNSNALKDMSGSQMVSAERVFISDCTELKSLNGLNLKKAKEVVIGDCVKLEDISSLRSCNKTLKKLTIQCCPAINFPKGFTPTIDGVELNTLKVDMDFINNLSSAGGDQLQRIKSVRKITITDVDYNRDIDTIKSVLPWEKISGYPSSVYLYRNHVGYGSKTISHKDVYPGVCVYEHL